MGGISFIIYDSSAGIDSQILHGFNNIKHRGPDQTSFQFESTIDLSKVQNKDAIKFQLSRKEIAEYSQYTFVYGFHRLAVNDSSLDGMQPFEDPIQHKISQFPQLRMRPQRKLLCNGEIYNWKELITQENFGEMDLVSQSDVEVILPLYIKYGLQQTLNKINGDFSFVLTENINTFNLKTLNTFVVRDPLGIKPLYFVKHQSNNFYMFVSELKAIPKYILQNDKYIVQEFPPGTYWSFKNSIVDKNPIDFIRYNDFDIYKSLDMCSYTKADPDTLNFIYETIKTTVTESVNEMIPVNQSFGVLLSGGFNSCLLLALTIEYLINNDIDVPVYVFTIATENTSKDAENFVNYIEKKYNIDILHHIVYLDSNSLQDTISKTHDVIYSVESFDPKTIRESLYLNKLFNYIAEKNIKERLNIKVLLSGHGFDELCGYQNLFCGSDQDFQNLSIKLLKHLSYFQLNRTDKLASVYGLEIRYPFLNVDFIKFILSIHPSLKRPQIYDSKKIAIEKYIIRKSFDLTNNPLLEQNYLWKSYDKNNNFKQFYEDLSNHWSNYYSDIEFKNKLDKLVITNDYIKNSQKLNFSLALPKTKEELHYILLFNNIFPNSLNMYKYYFSDLI